jgi:hypothetical protein
LKGYGGAGLFARTTEMSNRWVPLTMFRITVCLGIVFSSR